MIAIVQDGTQQSMVDDEVLWTTDLSVILNIKESQIHPFQDAAKYLPSLWLGREVPPSSHHLPGRLTLPIQDIMSYIPEGRSHPMDYGKSILIWW